jgi:glycosyltransferase involved in cell wall biosynthesis
VHVLVEAFNRLPEAGVECGIWGDLTFLPDYVDELRRARRHLDVRLMGPCDNRRVADVLAALDVLVVPSLWLATSPLTSHEAFLAGVPVLCADRGGMAGLVQDGVSGLHFRLGDAADLRAKIERLMREPELLARLRAGIPPVKDIADDARWLEARLAELAGTGARG